jgi:hypothetical protein
MIFFLPVWFFSQEVETLSGDVGADVLYAAGS